MPIATPEVYRDMLDRAKAGSFAYPAINVTSSQTLNAAIRGFAEAGSGKVLSGMAKRIAPDAEATPLNTPADLEAFAKSL